MNDRSDILELFTSDSSSKSLERSMSFREYRTITGDYLHWNFITEYVRKIRCFPQGLEFAFRIVSTTERFKDRLSKRDYEYNLIMGFVLALNMLDMMDRWDDYLDAWEQIEKNTPTLRAPNNERYHRLWFHLIARRRVIEGKIEKRNAGKELGNLYHAKQSDLTEEELQERIDQSLRVLRRWDDIHRVYREKR